MTKNSSIKRIRRFEQKWTWRNPWQQPGGQTGG